MSLTVFLASYNRLDTLRRTVMSYRRLADAHELVIVDNGSDEPRCQALLDELERWPEVRKVYRLDKIRSMDELTANYNVALADQYARLRKPETSWFAVTDADISFDGTNRRCLDAYMRLARRTGDAVGPHTRVDAGIPVGYPLRSRVLSCESRLLYRASMNFWEGIPYSSWAIDTTFHLFPATPEHRRLRLNTIRCGPPFDAMHLDWYVDVFAPTEENPIYMTVRDGETVGSWGRNWLADFWWRFQADPEKAYHHIEQSRKNTRDLCTNSFLLSWCYQIGLAGSGRLRDSVAALYDAIPARFADYWAHRADWLAMIYRSDFRCLGWQAPVKAETAA